MRLIFVVPHQQQKNFNVEFFSNYGICNNFTVCKAFIFKFFFIKLHSIGRIQVNLKNITVMFHVTTCGIGICSIRVSYV